eukprot:TRINITY_DN1395_c0_g1_i2.p1 TRINITY_DN1395_c0_g1~~TRINITY_DN1395_c0_g1_i2.p1  ORF type:complete len:258 (+),score=97.70 TRINITY_DN1395_c0_g1_i2:78-851(+)
MNMEENLFLSRHDLLKWLNDLLGTSYSKVEELSSGVAFCLVFHDVYPDALHKTKILYSAKHDYESLKNFKLLQSGFVKKKIGKTIEAEKLVRGKYIDNFQFLQWIKWFHDSHAKERPLEGEKSAEEEEDPVGSVQKEKNKRTEKVVGRSGGYDTDGDVDADGDGGNEERKNEGKTRSGETVAEKARSKISMKKGGTTVERGGVQSKRKGKMQILKETIEALEEERDFYFQKLRDIEILIQTCKWQDHPLLEELRDVL